MNNLQRKYNITDRMMSPFMKMPPQQDIDASQIMGMEKKKKERLRNKVLSLNKDNSNQTLFPPSSFN